LEKTTVGVVSHILALYILGGHEGGFGVITRFKKKHYPGSGLTNKNVPILGLLKLFSIMSTRSLIETDAM
jgi:hypothetical protein